MSSNTQNLTCLACHVAFSDPDIHRMHYKTDWHRYNLKCRVSQLPPITAEEFQQKVITHRNLENEAQKDEHTYCQACKKGFTNQKAYDNHLNSKKHKINEKNYEPSEASTDASTVNRKQKKEEVVSKAEEMDFDDSDIEELDSDEWDEESENPVDNNDCIFCMHHSRSFLKNLEHMTTVHSFFIPDIEFCTDVQGLLRYLADKVSEGYMCLWCNDKGKTFHSADAARQHMVDKGHCRMLHEGLALAEYADFYDYSSSYPDAENGEADADEEVEVPEIDGSEYQLVLPSGVTVGHRSLMRYYKQHLNPNSVALVPKKNERKLHKVLATYRRLGWTTTEQEAVARGAKDLHALKRMHAKMTLKLGLKGNKLQKHFRQQINF